MQISPLLFNTQLSKEIRIVPKRGLFQLRKNLYSVMSPKGEHMGQFGFHPDGLITDLKLSKKLRRKTEGLSALWAIKKFITKKARKTNLDFVSFYADENNPNNVMRLYQKFAISSDDVFMLPVSSKGRKRISQILDLAPLSIR